jgi:hypothetical protein
MSDSLSISTSISIFAIQHRGTEFVDFNLKNRHNQTAPSAPSGNVLLYHCMSSMTCVQQKIQHCIKVEFNMDLNRSQFADFAQPSIVTALTNLLRTHTCCLHELLPVTK